MTSPDLRTNPETASARASAAPLPPVVISVGYGWDNEVDVRQDDRWTSVRTLLRSVAQDAESRARRAIASRRIPGDDDETPGAAGPSETVVPGVRIARLRATPGGFVWPSIVRHINESDVLVFDINQSRNLAPDPTAADIPTVTPNVWLELGYALGTGKPVYVTHELANGHRSLPSDLQGLMVGLVPDGGAAVDIALRMSLVQEVTRLLIARAFARPTNTSESAR